MDSWFSELRSGTAPSSSRTSSLTTPIQNTRKKTKSKSGSTFAARAKEKAAAESGKEKVILKKKKKKKKSVTYEQQKPRPGTSGDLSDLNRVLRQQVRVKLVHPLSPLL